MRVDLHTHSNVSDGSLSPAALVDRAKEYGVELLALTDHDTTAGIAEASIQARQVGIQLVAGVEFSSQWSGRGIHIVGLGVDPTADQLIAANDQQQQVRLRRAEMIAAKLEKLGCPNALAGAQELAGTSVIGRPHFAQYMLNVGMVKNLNAAFKKYLGAGKPGDIKLGWPEFEEVVGWITGAGGVAVVAHPDKYKMTRTKLCHLLDDFIEAGGQGIEVVSGNQDRNVTNKLLQLAELKQLWVSTGSDFHHPGRPWNELGSQQRLPKHTLPNVWEHVATV